MGIEETTENAEERRKNGNDKKPTERNRNYH